MLQYFSPLWITRIWVWTWIMVFNLSLRPLGPWMRRGSPVRALTFLLQAPWFLATHLHGCFLSHPPWQCQPARIPPIPATGHLCRFSSALFRPFTCANISFYCSLCSNWFYLESYWNLFLNKILFSRFLPVCFLEFFFLFGLWDYRHCGHSWPIEPASGDNEDDCGEHDGM
jgi:hypothetical protein